jgi:hypothetical protein
MDCSNQKFIIGMPFLVGSVAGTTWPGITMVADEWFYKYT